MIVQSNNCYQFVEDYVFSSPSTAGGVILGRATNGWTKWRNSEGKTLDEVAKIETEDYHGGKAPKTGTDLASKCTITIDAFLEAIAEAGTALQ